MNLKPFLAPFAAAVALIIAPQSALADRKVKVYRDLDGDGHYNKKSYHVDRHRGHYHGHSRSYYGYGRPSYYGSGYRSSYYRTSYYGSPYSYGYGRSYSSYPRTIFGISFSSRPTYYSTSRAYRSYDRSDSLAVEVQSALRSRGYYRGPIDGDIGSGSRAAIRAYQRDRGLPTTGRIDSSLLRSLRIG